MGKLEELKQIVAEMFEKATEKRSKIGIYEDEEYFIDTPEFGSQNYIFFKYAKEVELN